MSNEAVRQIPPADMDRFKAMARRIPAYLRLAKSILLDPDVSLKSKALLGIGGTYALSPIDLIPGIIPVAGQLDDAYVLLQGLKLSLKTMPSQQADRHLNDCGVNREDIDEDLELVIRTAGKIAHMVMNTGVTIGRAGKTGYRYVSDRIRGWRTR